ncbi:toll/interleukin-1 receptor domain-containing protein [Pleurocapsa sp. PCC 7319]|uniref:toll/interleukin-1 receptor domain-containing protein n=1 Tax=Pleurocapsa sp. PCC 7319 TaxID=118161 RepID=UPI000349B5D6|nr:toll/interleukin-1 receptor domain-containing protein [Pleurocapsa sp. PCC 7319]
MSSFFDAFISYGHTESQKFVTKLYERLTEVGLKVWIDQRDIDDSVKWQKEIDRGIETAHNLIFIVTPHAVKSPYCLIELELAVKYNKRLIPLLHVEPSDCWDRVHPAIAEIQFIFFQDGIDDFEDSFERLVSSIKHQADYIEQHTRYLVKALEWERHQKQTNYLLIGEDRNKAESWLRVRFKEKQQPCIPTDLHCEYICESSKNAQNLLTQVFICHDEKDSLVRDRLVKQLHREGITTWTNRSDIPSGSEFQEEINKGIEGTDNLVYLVSANSVVSFWCKRELNHALKYNKRIIPLLIERTISTHSTSSRLAGGS